MTTMSKHQQDKVVRSTAADEARILDETISFWQPLSPRTLTREDARQIRENLTGFFRVLSKWEAEKPSGEESAEPEKRAS